MTLADITPELVASWYQDGDLRKPLDRKIVLAALGLEDGDKEEDA